MVIQKFRLFENKSTSKYVKYSYLEIIAKLNKNLQIYNNKYSFYQKLTNFLCAIDYTIS